MDTNENYNQMDPNEIKEILEERRQTIKQKFKRSSTKHHKVITVTALCMNVKLDFQTDSQEQTIHMLNMDFEQRELMQTFLCIQ